MNRLMADCRRFPNESDCTLTLIGEEDELVEAAVSHVVKIHGNEDTPALREQLRGMLEQENAYVPGEREKEALPH